VCFYNARCSLRSLCSVIRISQILYFIAYCSIRKDSWHSQPKENVLHSFFIFNMLFPYLTVIFSFLHPTEDTYYIYLSPLFIFCYLCYRYVQRQIDHAHLFYYAEHSYSNLFDYRLGWLILLAITYTNLALCGVVLFNFGITK
jgi:hypothetical protein